MFSTLFGLVVLYGVSTLVGYLIPNPIYIYIYKNESHGNLSTYLSTLKTSKSDKQDIQDTAGEVRTNSKVTFSCGPLHTDVQV